MGEKSAYIEKNEGTVNLYHGEQQSLSTEEILLNINNASVDYLVMRIHSKEKFILKEMKQKTCLTG